MFGCTKTIEKPVQEGVDCKDNLVCLTTNFIVCEKAFGTIIDKNEEIYLQILETKNDKCEVYLQLNKSSKAPSILLGLNAKCRVNIAELIELQQKMNFEELDCEGPLYDAALNAKNFGLIK